MVLVRWIRQLKSYILGVHVFVVFISPDYHTCKYTKVYIVGIPNFKVSASLARINVVHHYL
jgi:hypothetical protein